MIKGKVNTMDIIKSRLMLCWAHYFYNIESYALLRNENGVYVSFDPYTEDEIISPESRFCFKR